MTLTAASGPISEAMNTAMLTFADNAAFRSWVGASTQAKALLHIHQDDLPEKHNGERYEISELQLLRPFVIISTGSPFRKEWVAHGAYDQFVHTGVFNLLFEADVSADHRYNPGEVARVFENAIGDILDGFDTLVGTGGYLELTSIEIDAPMRTDEEMISTYGDAMMCTGRIEWGIGGE